MKVLFISSGNNKFGVGPVVRSQGDSLSDNGVEISYFIIRGKGIMGYLKAAGTLKKELEKKQYDILHAHYSLSAFTATLSFSGIPLMVSLMGSDTKMSLLWRILIRFCSRFFWKAVIVKSPEMKTGLKLKSAHVIPNGVDLDKLFPMEAEKAKKELGFDPGKKHLIFLSNPGRTEKNYSLAKQAVEVLNDVNVLLHVVHGVPHEDVKRYLNAADCLLSTSLWEGSPNAIKEAMACNCPVVSTDVGDIRWLFGETGGYYLCSFDPVDVADKIKQALDFGNRNGRTSGRDRITELGLDSDSIAVKIISIYQEIIEKERAR